MVLISNSKRDFWSSVNLESHFSLLNDDVVVVVEDEEEEEVGGAVGVKKEVIDLDFLTVVDGVVDLVSSESGALRLVFEVDIVGFGLFIYLLVGDGMGNGEKKKEMGRRGIRYVFYQQELARS